MTADAARDMKLRLRSDLVAAMRGRQRLEVAVIRDLVAAIDNAEAPADHVAELGTTEIARLVLSEAEVRELLSTEIRMRERAICEFERLGNTERADQLRAEVVVVRRYI